MLTWLMNMLSNPNRGLRTAITAIVIATVLLVALVHAAPGTLHILAAIIGILVVLAFITHGWRHLGPLVATAVVITGAVSLVGEVLASPALPLLVVGAVVAGTLGVWVPAGAPCPG